MMKYILPWPKRVAYKSLLWLESESLPGVEFSIRRASLANRVNLLERIRQLTAKYEFLKAGDVADQTEAQLSDLLVRQLYVEWGIDHIRGLIIDGRAADVPLLIAKGPDFLVAEMADAIQQSLQLNEFERKNF